MLACSGARALALSLLRRGQGVHGPTSPDHDVVWEACNVAWVGWETALGLVTDCFFLFRWNDLVPTSGQNKGRGGRAQGGERERRGCVGLFVLCSLESKK